MFCFLKYLVEFIFNLRKSRKDLLIQITVLQKEVEILRRSKGRNRLWIKKADRVILAILNSISQIKEICTSIKAPNLNAISERFIRSIRQEALDYFLIIGKRQIYEIIKAYIDYYNSKRPHQGLQQKIPSGYTPQKSGRVHKFPILGGLCHHYQRRAA